MAKFKICSVGWNCERFIQQTLDSVVGQSVTDWEIAITYDPSDDKGAEVIEAWCAKDPEQRKFRINTEKKWAPRNQYEAIHEMLQPEDDDIIVFLDLDGDKFAHEDVLAHLLGYYQNGELLTYGQYRPIPDLGTSTYASEWPREVVRDNSYRTHVLTVGTCFNHLRTMKGQVFNAIPIQNFQWPNGAWYEGATDYIVMISGFELVNGRYKFVEEVLLDYNHDNPHADNKTHPEESASCTVNFLRHPSLQPLQGLPNLYMSGEERREVIRQYGESYGLRSLVETGTDSGETPFTLKDSFRRIFTIELSRERHAVAANRLRPYKNIFCFWGDSGELLPKILDMLDEPTLFWLDGHCSGPGTARGKLDTPIRQELETLFAESVPHVILVDDARCFKGGMEHFLEPHYADYPSLDWVRELAEANGYKYELKNDIMRLTP